MSFDPKVNKLGPNVAPPAIAAQREAQAGREARGKGKVDQSPPLAAPDLDAARAASKQKGAAERPMPRLDRAGASRIEQKFAEHEHALAKKTATRALAAKSAMAFCTTYSARSSRGARARASNLCDLLDDVSGQTTTADALRAGLSLDEALQMSDAEGLLAGLTAAANVDASADTTVRALVLALASQALTMLAEHFPASIEGLDAPLDQAFSLAEEALALAPELAEAHVALGQLVLLHGDPEAMRDADMLLQRALRLEADHDGAQMALATLAYCRHDPRRALTILGSLQTTRPLALLLTARAQRAMRLYEEAAATLEGAIEAAPQIAALHVEASVIDGLLKDEEGAARHRMRAAELLGPTIDVDDAIALCFAGHSS